MNKKLTAAAFIIMPALFILPATPASALPIITNDVTSVIASIQSEEKIEETYSFTPTKIAKNTDRLYAGNNSQNKAYSKLSKASQKYQNLRTAGSAAHDAKVMEDLMAQALSISVVEETLPPDADPYSTSDMETFDYPDSNFDINKVVEMAYSEVGTARPTGWAAEGECIMSVKRWLTQSGSGAVWGGAGTPLDNYTTAKRVNHSDLRPGDVVQYIVKDNPSAWEVGIHTVLITGVNDDGTFKIVESNNPGGSGLVKSNDKWTPKPPSGFEAHYYRF